MLDSRAPIVRRRMRALEFLDDHALAHAGIAMDEQAGHPIAPQRVEHVVEDL